MKEYYDSSEICKQCVLFARVSTEDQYNKGLSNQSQLTFLNEYADKKGFKVIKVYDIPESSTKRQRKQFFEMLDFVKSQTHKTAIVAHCVDRLQRTYNEYCELNKLREEGRIELHFIRENLIIHQDSNSADIARWDFGILGAKMYVGNLVDNVKRVQVYKWSQGQWQSFAPIGYLNIINEDGKSDIIVDPDRAPLVQKLFEDYATGNESLASLAEKAAVWGLKSSNRKCKHTLSRSQIADMLSNSFYIGTMTLRRRRRPQNKNKPPQSMPHKYPHLISKELFERVQNILNEKSHCNTTNTSKPWYGEKDFALRGLIRCSHCGCLMSAERHTKKSGKVYTYIRCNHTKKDCTQKPIPEELIFKQIEENVLGEMKLTSTLIKNIQKAVKEGIKEDTKLHASYRRSLSLQLEDIKERKSKLLDAWLDKRVDETIYESKLSELNQKQTKIEEMLAEYDNKGNNLDEELEKISDIALHAKQIFRSSINAEKRKILKLILSNSEVNGKNVMFSIRKPFNKLLFSKGCTVWYLQSDSN